MHRTAQSFSGAVMLQETACDFEPTFAPAGISDEMMRQIDLDLADVARCDAEPTAEDFEAMKTSMMTDDANLDGCAEEANRMLAMSTLIESVPQPFVPSLRSETTVHRNASGDIVRGERWTASVLVPGDLLLRTAGTAAEAVNGVLAAFEAWATARQATAA